MYITYAQTVLWITSHLFYEEIDEDKIMKYIRINDLK